MRRQRRRAAPFFKPEKKKGSQLADDDFLFASKRKTKRGSSLFFFFFRSPLLFASPSHFTSRPGQQRRRPTASPARPRAARACAAAGSTRDGLAPSPTRRGGRSFSGDGVFFLWRFFFMREKGKRHQRSGRKRKINFRKKKGKTPSLFLSLTLNPSVKTRCASLNSGVEKESLGSSSRRRASSCREERRRRKREEGEREEETRKRGGFSQSSCGDAARKKGGKENAL